MPKVGKLIDGKVVSNEDRLYDALLTVLYRATAQAKFNCCHSLRLGQSLMREEGKKSVERILALVQEYIDFNPGPDYREHYEGIVKSAPTLDEDIPF